MSGPFTAVTIAAALGCGLAGGVFFAFSTFVMAALRDLSPAQGITAMQSINRVAVTPAFMALLFGTALVCVVVAIWAAINHSWWALAGAVLYLAGTILVTIAANVPMNDTLASVPANGPGAADHWARYASGWTAWNHLRTVAAAVAAAMLMLALR